MTDSTYSEALAAYTTQLRGMFSAPAGMAPSAGVARGAGVEVPVDVLADRAENMVTASRTLGNLTVPFLESESQPVREAAEMKLLAQANAELEVALALLEATGNEASGETTGTTRGGRTTASQQAINRLIGVLEIPLEMGMTPFVEESIARGVKSKDIPSACKALKDQVEFSLDTIVRQAARSSSRALDTLLSLDTSLLQQGVALLDKGAADLLAKISSGLNDLLQRLSKAAMQLLLQAYDWVLALIGKDTEKVARMKIKEWIDDLRPDHNTPDDTPKLATELVKRVFNPAAVTVDLNERMARSKADLDALNKMVENVETIGANYEAKTKQAETFLKLVGAVKMLPLPVDKLPYVQVAMAAVVLGLMGYVLYAGYDHVDTGKLTFFNKFGVNIPDRVTGIRATLEKALI